MPHFRLCYRDSSQRFKITLVEARSLMHARLRAVLGGQNGGMIFTEGHELSAYMVPLVRPRRVLSADEAMELFGRLETDSANRPPPEQRGSRWLRRCPAAESKLFLRRRQFS
jgi:hypothetical protein